MESLKKMKELLETISIDTKKVFTKGNRSASVRARQNAQLLKDTIKKYRQDIIDEMKKQDIKNESEIQSRIERCRKNNIINNINKK